MRQFDPERIVRGMKKATLLLAKDLHDTANTEHLIPRDTGFLADVSPKFHQKSNYAEIHYTAEYAGYVWEKNVTGVPKWIDVAWRTHNREMLHNFWKEAVK